MVQKWTAPYVDAMRNSLTELCNDLRHHCAAMEASTSKNASSRQCFARRLSATMAEIRGFRDDTKSGNCIRLLKVSKAFLFAAGSMQRGGSQLLGIPWQ